ncbi:hypothetical protein H2248_001560 [Termitomyces sp. 'cryptogamus']|nr:hypothetical protein H2248_001560 [Termitomyces sp. 'cryptogamus']
MAVAQNMKPTSKTWNKHQADDQVTNLTKQFALTCPGTNGLQQALQSAQEETIHSQERDIVASLAEGQTYPSIELTHSTPALQTLKVLEKIDN